MNLICRLVCTKMLSSKRSSAKAVSTPSGVLAQRCLFCPLRPGWCKRAVCTLWNLRTDPTSQARLWPRVASPVASPCYVVSRLLSDGFAPQHKSLEVLKAAGSGWGMSGGICELVFGKLQTGPGQGVQVSIQRIQALERSFGECKAHFALGNCPSSAMSR